jgi:hypothetical protein
LNVNFKKKIMKKIIFILFAVVSWQHSLAQNFTYGGLKYNVTRSTTLEVGSSGGATGIISILSRAINIDVTCYVTKSGYVAFAIYFPLPWVTIPQMIKSTDDFALRNCASLTS